MPVNTAQSHAVDTKIRHVLLHYHLFKNAGSSIDAILERNFGSRLAYLHGMRHDSTVTNADLVHFLAANGDVRAVSSHHLRPPKPRIEEFVFFDIVFLRHPLDRLRSMYDFYRRNEAIDDPLVEQAHRFAIGQFMEFLIAYYPHLTNNVQVCFFASSGQYTRPPNNGDLQRAIGVITEAAVLGVTELFDFSMGTARYYLYPTFGALDLKGPAQNVSAARAESLEERLQHMEASCGSNLYKSLLRMNELDLQLVKCAEAEIHRRFNEIPKVVPVDSGTDSA